MIAFLAITTVINIALGYALAIYLGNAKARLEPTTEAEGNTLTLPTRKLATHEAPAQAPTTGTVESRPESLAAPSLADALMAEAHEEPLDHAAAGMANEIDLAGRAATGSPPEEESPVEQELLAGIEEFRSQLAQLKGATSAEPAVAPRPMIATTA